MNGVIYGGAVAGSALGRDVKRMARKPAKMYRRVKGQSYTRREYTGGIPNSRITQFHMGNRPAGEAKDFPVQLSLQVDDACQIRHTALEAARIIVNATIRKAAGPQGYSLRVRVYPHQVLRENKQATGAGADRVSQGMRCSFGKNVGTAARVQKNQKVITIQTNPANFEAAKDALRKANCKLPSPSTIVVDRGHEVLKGLV